MMQCAGNFPRHAACGLLILIAGCGGSGGGSPALAPAPPPPAPPGPPAPPPETILELDGLPGGNGFLRVSGAASTGRFGVPVAGGLDCDGDGNADFAMSAMQASPFGRDGAGQVHLVFGDGTIEQSIDTASASANVLVIAGAAPSEAAGNEIWMDDVTGDGVGDLLIGRQNYREPVSDRIGAGALTIVPGGALLRDLATNGTVLDLAAPPPGIATFTLVGAAALDRLGFWMRTGDVTGDGLADVVVGADQEDLGAETNRGAAYVVRGGAHLDDAVTIDLAAFGATPLAGQIARLTPPADSADYHFGATVGLADLDDNGRDEVLVAASLSRVGGLLVADGAPPDSAVRNGGNLGGSLFIFWDDNFPAGDSWADGYALAADAAPGSITRIDGGAVAGVFTNERFGEEVLGGLDYDADGSPDLFVGDIHGSRPDSVWAGVGHVFFSASNLIGRSFAMDAVPADLGVTTILGPSAGAISCDTSLHGDIDGDGIADLVVASPLANPQQRIEAGVMHVLWGQPGPWPALIDLASGARPDPTVFAITDIHGAAGARSLDDAGDTLMYSGLGADIDADGRADLVINEMRGNGIDAAALDVGNLIIVGGATVPRR